MKVQLFSEGSYLQRLLESDSNSELMVVDLLNENICLHFDLIESETKCLGSRFETKIIKMCNKL